MRSISRGEGGCSGSHCLSLERYLAQLTVGTKPHRGVMRAIELLATEVAPAVRQALVPATQR